MEDSQRENIEETLRNLPQEGEEPGSLTKGKPVTSDEPFPEGLRPRVVDLKSAGYTPVWDTKTGVRSLINNNMLPRTLRKTRPDGSYVFTAKRPSVVPRRGIYKCLLHPSDSHRKHYDELGLAVCPKDNLSSPYQVERHMKKKHKMEWEAIEKERIDKEKEEDREFQRRLMERVSGEAPLYVSNKKKAKSKK